MPDATKPAALIPTSFTLHRGSIHAFLLSAQTSTPEETACLSPSERNRAAAFATPALQNLYTTAHIALRQLLSACTAIAAPDLIFTTNDWGKPALIHPIAGPHFNISHSGDKILIALSRDGPIGVDIELIRRDPPYEIVTQVFSPKERECLVNLPQRNRALAFYQLWTRKEALCKAIGHGLDIDLASISTCENLAAQTSTAELSGPLAALGRWSLYQLPTTPLSLHYATAIASRHAPRKLLVTDCASASPSSQKRSYPPR